ncbi:hypothetical protein OHA01_31900 [Micromonospora zamorensis]|uniref:ABC-three component system protein n=1 Tax=Micromonospora zamorensis TaxID=709883 RepID=UPI003866BAA6|nr:hypothetical protein OHA01_31900 [Micromonospora zamorensis]
MDDIDFMRDGTPDELLQVKHHVTAASDLTEYNVDLWRSINAWLDTVDLSLDRIPVLRLLTTADVPSGGVLCRLRDGSDRDAVAALSALEAAATNSNSKQTEPWRKSFLNRSPEHRAALVAAIVVQDGAPRAADIDKSLRRAFGYIVPRGREDDYIRYLKGWWSGISVSLLDRSLQAIRAEDLRIQAEDLRDQFGPQALPLDPQVMAKFSAEDAEIYRGRTFVTQLLWIALDENRLLKAIRDYHRAYTQRSEWLRRGYLCEAEVDRFAFALHDEWEQVFDRLVARAERSGGASLEDTGMAILEEICANSRARIRERFDQGWLNRGTMHQLAEGFAGLTIGWHPDFETKLETLLQPVVAKEPVS